MHKNACQPSPQKSVTVISYVYINNLLYILYKTLLHDFKPTRMS